MQNVAIFGGTFNPVHWGHILIATIALEEARLDQVIWVPSHQPPHKTTPLPDFAHRLEMVRLAIADQAKFTVSDIEVQRSGVSYAITTFTELRSFYPTANWHWIIGSDAFQSLPKWRGSNVLASECTWLVAPRQAPEVVEQDYQTILQHLPPQNIDCRMGGTPSEIAISSQKIILRDICQPVVAKMAHRSIQLRCSPLPMLPINISSSLIRAVSHMESSLEALVPQLVGCYIAKHKLYAK